jgi:hypothetical protein
MGQSMSRLMSLTENPRYWHVDQVIYYHDGSSVTLKARWPGNNGWSLEDGGGLADIAVEQRQSRWSTIPPTSSKKRDHSLTLKAELRLLDRAVDYLDRQHEHSEAADLVADLTAALAAALPGPTTVDLAAWERA